MRDYAGFLQIGSHISHESPIRKELFNYFIVGEMGTKLRSNKQML